MAFEGIKQSKETTDPTTIGNPPAGTYYSGIDSAGLWIKDDSGTITRPDIGSGFDYTEDWTTLASGTNNVWTLRNLGVAPDYAEKVVEITTVVSSNNTTVGVREIGSALVRNVRIDIDSASTMTVKTDSSGDIEIFSSDWANTTMRISAKYQ